MESNKNLDELLISYLMNELSGEEEAHVLEKINSDQEIRKYFEELKATLKVTGIKQAFDEVNIDKEWALFEQARDGRDAKTMFVNEAERFGNGVIKEVELKRRTAFYKSLAFAAVAASVILAIGLGWILFNNEKPVQQKVAVTEKKAIPAQPFTRHLTNHSGTTKRYTLQDGTIVLLSENSELSFREPFDSYKRDIHLTGKATFEVAKDKSKPFTVFSGDVSTTALGTKFSVTAHQNSRNIIVSLHEGKVVVKCNGCRRVKEFYLLPGQELTYNKIKNNAIVKTIERRETPSKPDLASKNPSPTDNPVAPEYGNSSWYMFNNQPLYEVFDQLADMYNVKIEYSKKEISKLYFIGTFDKSDSLESVLKQIASSNNLTVTRQEQGFKIKK